MKLLSLLCLSVLLASVVCDPQGGGAGGGGGGPDGSQTNNNQNTNNNNPAVTNSPYPCAPLPDKTDKTETWTPYKPRILQHLEACKMIDTTPGSKVCGIDTTACKKFREEDAKDVHEKHKDADISCGQQSYEQDQEHECEEKCASDSACAKPKSCSCGLCTITCMKEALRRCPDRFAVYFEFFKILSQFDIKAESTFDSCRQLIDFPYERYSRAPTVAATDPPADEEGETDAPTGDQTTEGEGEQPADSTDEGGYEGTTMEGPTGTEQDESTTMKSTKGMTAKTTTNKQSGSKRATTTVPNTKTKGSQAPVE